MGRPPKPDGETRTARLSLRLHPAERTELEEIADRLGLQITQLVLVAVRDYARRA